VREILVNIMIGQRERQFKDAKKMLLASATLCLFPTAVFAQSATPPAAVDSDEASTEIVVTAQKRSEKLQDVPIAISAIDGEKLDRTTLQGSNEVLNRLPNIVAVPANLGMPAVVIRGIAGSGAGSTSALYIDSVPFTLASDARVPNIDVYDLERMEVLRGPQGTLYGANSMAGVIRVITKGPNLDEFEFKVRGKVSDTKDGGQNYRGDAVVNIPIVDGKVAARLWAGYEDIAGWVDRPARLNPAGTAIDKPAKKDTNSQSIRNVRAKLRAEPSDELSLEATGWISRISYNAQNIGSRNRTNRAPDDDQGTNNFNTYSLRAEYDAGFASLTSTTSYIDFKARSRFSSGALAPTAALPRPDLRVAVSMYDQTIFSQEAYLNSQDLESWSWTVGAAYRDATGRTRRYTERATPFIPSATPPSDIEYSSKSVAVFGSVTKELFDDRVELTGGLRYFHAKVGMNENISSFNPARPLLSVSDSFNSLTPRLAVTWKPVRNFTAYASYSRGFREGIAQTPQSVSVLPTVPITNPDTLDNYEIGAKGTVLDGLLTFDSALFYLKWKDIQTSQTQIIGSVPIAATFNSGAATGWGGEASFTVRPVRGFEFGGQVGYTRLESDDTIISQTATPQIIRAEGVVFNRPKWTLGAWAEYSFAVGGDLQGRFNASVDHQSRAGFYEARAATFGTPLLRSFDRITTARASVSIERPDRWTATLFVDNLNDEKGTGNNQSVSFGIDDWANRPQPRTIGLQLEYKY
jgi:outer membrane receptor protein involved in Fe transport